MGDASLSHQAEVHDGRAASTAPTSRRRAGFAWAHFGHTWPRSGYSDSAELPWLARQSPASRVLCGYV